MSEETDIERIERIVSGFQDRVALVAKQHEEKLTKTAERMEKMMAAYSDAVVQTGQQLAETKQEKSNQKPQAVWTEQGGEKLMVMNYSAVELIAAIFNTLEPVLQELSKQSQSSNRK